MTGEAPHWAVYGLSVASDRPFANGLSRTALAPDVTVATVDSHPLGSIMCSAKPSYRSPAMIDEQQPFLQVYETPAVTVFRFTEVVDFYLVGDQIAVHVLDPTYDAMVELHLLGFVLPFWLERGGHRALHAAGVVFDGVTAAFVGRHGTGKTSLAATLVTLGHPLASDDIVVVESVGETFLARPGYPQMRMLPEQALHFLGRADFVRAHPANQKLRVPVGPRGLGTFDVTARPLVAVYVPERRANAEFHIEAVPPSQALFTLVRHSMLIGIVEALEMAPRRFTDFAALIRQVSVRRVTYPDGLEHLPGVAAKIAADVRATCEQRAASDESRATGAPPESR